MLWGKTGGHGKGGYTDSMATLVTANTGKHSDTYRTLSNIVVGRRTVAEGAWAAFVSSQKTRVLGT